MEATTRQNTVTLPLKVSGKTHPGDLGAAIVESIKQSRDRTTILEAIGPQSVNQAVKGIAVARGYTSSQGWDLVSVPSFDNKEINGQETTTIRMIVKDISPLS